MYAKIYIKYERTRRRKHQNLHFHLHEWFPNQKLKTSRKGEKESVITVHL